jgi:hypothetical protein
MSIVSVTRLPEGWSGGFNQNWERHYRQVFRVTTSDRLDGPNTVYTASDPVTGLTIPLRGAAYYVTATERDPGSFVQSIEPAFESFAAEAGGCSWLVAVTYGQYQMNTWTEDPIGWPLRIQFGGTQQSKIAYVDKDGKAVMNSADDYYDPPPEVDDSRSVLIVSRNEGIHDFDFLKTEYYRDCVNDALWNGFAARQLKLGLITTGEPQSKQVGGSIVWYYQVNYPFSVNRDTWDSKLLDQGFTRLDGDSPPVYDPVSGLEILHRVEIRDKHGQRPSAPVFLDGDGNELPTTSPVVVKDFRIYAERDFSALSLDFSAAVGRT